MGIEDLVRMGKQAEEDLAALEVAASQDIERQAAAERAALLDFFLERYAVKLNIPTYLTDSIGGIEVLPGRILKVAWAQNDQERVGAFGLRIEAREFGDEPYEWFYCQALSGEYEDEPYFSDQFVCTTGNALATCVYKASLEYQKYETLVKNYNDKTVKYFEQEDQKAQADMEAKARQTALDELLNMDRMICLAQEAANGEYQTASDYEKLQASALTTIALLLAKWMKKP